MVERGKVCGKTVMVKIDERKRPVLKPTKNDRLRTHACDSARQWWVGQMHDFAAVSATGTNFSKRRVDYIFTKVFYNDHAPKRVCPQ